MKIVTTYDRSDLIHRSIATLKDEIIKLAIAVSVVCLIFLFHLPSALVVIVTLPIAIIISFICMYYLGVTSNIMSLSGIAIAIGAMVDASIIMVENAHKKLEEWEQQGQPWQQNRCHHRGSPGSGAFTFLFPSGDHCWFSAGFYAASAGRHVVQTTGLYQDICNALFLLSGVTLTPVLMTLFIRGKIRLEDKNPVSRFLHKLYEPVARSGHPFPQNRNHHCHHNHGLTVYPFMKLVGIYAASL